MTPSSSKLLKWMIIVHTPTAATGASTQSFALKHFCAVNGVVTDFRRVMCYGGGGSAPLQSHLLFSFRFNNLPRVLLWSTEELPYDSTHHISDDKITQGHLFKKANEWTLGDAWSTCTHCVHRAWRTLSLYISLHCTLALQISNLSSLCILTRLRFRRSCQK